MKVLILGNSGMLGHTLTRYLEDNGCDVYSTSRGAGSLYGSNHFNFDVVKDDIQILNLKEMRFDYILNCVGLIRHQMLDNAESNLLATEINTLFPLKLLGALDGTSTKLIQIGTDCVFSGNNGQYTENSIKDPIDAYGYSKALGEAFNENQMILRCSIIGLEKNSHVSLMEWLLNHPLNMKVRGFTDHNWNGLTTLAFAKIVFGIISTGNFQAGTFHVVPDGHVTKYQLLVLIASNFRRNDLQIEPTASGARIDRTLSTEFDSRIYDFWKLAGYQKIPTHQDMLLEYAVYTSNELDMRGLA